ncbi:MAG: stage III sporulation protein AF [Angelakisella sp.]
MDKVQGWIFTICTGTLICGIVSALLPGKSYRRAIQLLLGLFLLFCFLLPIGMELVLPPVDIAAAEQQRLAAASDTKARLMEQVITDAEQRLHQQVKGVLQEYGVEEGQLCIQVDTDRNDRLTATVTLPKRLQDRQATLQSRLTAALGIEVTIHYDS